MKVSKGAKIRNRYNQVPHLTQDTNGKVTNSQQTPQTRAKRSALSETHDPKGQENKIYTIVKDRETFYHRHTVPITSCSEVKYVLKKVILWKQRIHQRKSYHCITKYCNSNHCYCLATKGYLMSPQTGYLKPFSACYFLT